jgi:anaerobic selenocysteine-containing dehydrogenase
MPARERHPRAHSACPHDCPSTCALDVEVIDGQTIGRVYGAKDNSYTAGTICAKVARYSERVHHPDRLTQPLRRVGPKGQGLSAFEPISWDEALDEVAGKFAQATATYGAESVWPYYFAGTMGLVQRDGINRLRHAMGYSRQHTTICTTLVDAGWEAGTGIKRGVDPREMVESDLIVMWGGNPVNTQVNVMHHVAQARRKRGAKFVVIDPYRTGTAEKADMHLMVRPGTDAALACAVMHVLFKEGFADRKYLADYTDVPDELEAHVAQRGPQWAATITGLSVGEIVEFARLYGFTQRSFLRMGYGLSRSRNGASSVHAASCLPAITGAWRHLGGGALYSNRALYGVDQSVIMGLDQVDTSIRVLDMSRIGPILCNDPRDLGDGPPVKAMLIQNTNPAVVAPESSRVREGFDRDDLFVCVHEQFMTETAALADIVLPATTFLEHDDLYQGGGHTFLHITRALISPIGESRSNHEVLCGLGKRLGATHPGFEMTEWELIDDALRRSGYPGADEAYAAKSVDCVKDFNTMHFIDGFAHPDGKFRFKPDWAAIGPNGAAMPPLPDFMPSIDHATTERPFRMVTAPARGFLNTSFTETPTSQKLEGRPTVLIHPDDCARLGIEKDSRTRIGNDQGSVVVHAQPFEGVQPGVVIVESVWPNAAFEEGIGINALISADAGSPNGGAVFHDTAVWLRAA